MSYARLTRARALWWIGVSATIFVGVAQARPPIEKAKPREKETTVIQGHGNVNADLGLALTRASDPGDSVDWWPRRRAGYERWLKVRRTFPRIKSRVAEMYLAALAEGFDRAVRRVPQTRFHFYLADTLNPSLWPAGGGFFVIHAGLLRHLSDEREFAFLVALELAHEVLEHNFEPVRAGDVKWEPGRWRDGHFDSWPVDFWAVLVGADPLVEGGFAYSLEQESEALELVYRFFQANGWEYESLATRLERSIGRLGEIPGASSLPSLHRNFSMAIRLPHRKRREKYSETDRVVSPESYQKIRADIEASSLQKYPWMLELVPYRELVLAERMNFEAFSRELHEFADLENRRIENRRGTSGAHASSFSSEWARYEKIRERHLERQGLASAKLARAYLRGELLFGHARWKETIENADRELSGRPGVEPLLWQKVRARQQLSEFSRCVREASSRWRHFDHRRALLSLECQFLEGRLSEAAEEALAYRKSYPFDLDGALWQGLVLIRTRRSLDELIREVGAFWGDRPAVRALEIFHLGLKNRPTEAKERFSFQSDLRYGDEEWGVFTLAQSWFRETYSPIPNDHLAEKLQALAGRHWPLAKFVRERIPKELLERR